MPALRKLITHSFAYALPSQAPPTVQKTTPPIRRPTRPLLPGRSGAGENQTNRPIALPPAIGGTKNPL